jgi:hypothetical protein
MQTAPRNALSRIYGLQIKKDDVAQYWAKKKSLIQWSGHDKEKKKERR